MKIAIPGGSGQVGHLLCRALQHEGHDLVVMSRHPVARPWRVVPWDGVTLGAWATELDGCDVVINLAGRSVNCRYTPAHRQQILESRVLSTRVVGQAIATARRPPRVWLQASTATIYSHRYDAANDERSGVIGGGSDSPASWKFSVDVAQAWESACTDAAVDRTRKVLLRSSVVMSPDRDGIFDTLLGLVRRGLGGSAGDGRQYVSWIHYVDFVEAIRWLIGHDTVEGLVNVAAPNPLPNAEFMRVLREAWGTPIGLPAARWMLAVGAIFLHTETELILKSRRVIPRRLLEEGFVFKYPTWPTAAHDLCRQWIALRTGSRAACARSHNRSGRTHFWQFR